MLEQSDISRSNGRRGKPDDLPEWKIPWHHREHDTQRLERDKAVFARGLDRLVGEKIRSVVSVEATRGRALRRLFHGSLERLAHLERHQAAVLVLSLLEKFPRAPDD